MHVLYEAYLEMLPEFGQYHDWEMPAVMGYDDGLRVDSKLHPFWYNR